MFDNLLSQVLLGFILHIKKFKHFAVFSANVTTAAIFSFARECKKKIMLRMLNFMINECITEKRTEHKK